jgi:hypothetical protein
MSGLFGRERSVITKHVRNVFPDGELDLGVTCAKFAQVRNGVKESATAQDFLVVQTEPQDSNVQNLHVAGREVTS